MVSWFAYTGLYGNIVLLIIMWDLFFMRINVLFILWRAGHCQRVLDCVWRHRQGTQWCAVNLITFIGRFECVFGWSCRGMICICPFAFWQHKKPIPFSFYLYFRKCSCHLKEKKKLICLFKLSWVWLYLPLLVIECLMQAVEVAESFRLFATITTSKSDISHALEGLFIWS